MQFFSSLSACFGNDDPSKKIYSGGCGWAQIGPIVSELLHNVILLGVFVAVIVIMYAGYVLVKGQGSSDSISSAKKIFMNIVIGMMLLVGAYYIVKFILDTLGVSGVYRQTL
jgi:hypothetical protein